MIWWKLLPVCISTFKVTTLLILILLAIRVSYLTDFSVVQRRRPGMDGRLMVMGMWMGWVFKSTPSVSFSPFWCSMCFSLFHCPCVSFNSEPLLFKYNLKMLHCCLLWPFVNNVLLLSSDWRKVKARLEWVGQGTLFPRQPVVLFTLMPFTLIFTFSLWAN